MYHWQNTGHKMFILLWYEMLIVHT
jgi:hypothetical protein